MPIQISEKPLSQAVRERRATCHFESTPVPEEHLRRILEAGLAAPSGYNLQPWRFVVVRDTLQRKKLRQAAMGQAKVEEAPVIVVACGDPQGWRHGDLDEMLQLAAANGYGGLPEHERARLTITNFLGGMPGALGGIGPDLAVWVNRHVMIALTTMMWTAEVLGYDTAPLEGFWEDKVKELLGIPNPIRVVALLAVGHGSHQTKPYAGRFPMRRLVFDEHWGNPFLDSDRC